MTSFLKQATRHGAVALVLLALLGLTALADDADIKVRITDTGTKYHKAGCQYLRQSDHTITLKEAKERGYTACKKCKPPK